MSFVYVGGDEATPPTYFEVLAADKLIPSFKSAIIYALSVLSVRHGFVHRLLHFEDEILALVVFLLDWHSISRSQGCFAETMYGLRRAPLRQGTLTTGQAQSHNLSQLQVKLSILTEALLPYIRSKLIKLVPAGMERGILHLARQSAFSSSAGSPFTATTPHESPLQRLACRALPWIHAGTEGMTFAYHLLFLTGLAPTHSPLLHLLGIKLSRVSAADMAASQKARSASRTSALQRAAAFKTPWLGQLRSWQLRARWLVTDHITTSIVVAVFAFKTLEWWFTSAEERLAVAKVLPPPPPPPVPAPHPKGVGLPSSTSLCPLCRCPVTNAAQLAHTGYVFCYPCIFSWTLDKGHCPVTLAPAMPDQIRKIYDAGT